MSEIKTPALGNETTATIAENTDSQTYSIDLLGKVYTVQATDPVDAYHKAELKRAEEKQKELQDIAQSNN